MVAGYLAKTSGRTSIAFDLGVAMLAFCLIAMIAYRRFVKTLSEDKSSYVSMILRRA